jgi:hypothetical protein
MITREQLKWLEVVKVRKLGTNNVEVFFREDDGKLSAPLLIGKKQLVVTLEKAAGEFSPTDFPHLHIHLSTFAKECRDRFWPRTV